MPRADRLQPRVFERLAEAYRARPPYPDALVVRLSELAGAGRTVVDLGAGTGLLAVPLARRGHPVTAVEPASAMREECARAAVGLPVSLVAAPAEATGLAAASAGLVLLADAVHWVRPDRAGLEAARLIAPDGVAAVVEVEPLDTPFMRGVRALLAAANPRARPRDDAGRIRQWLVLAAGAGVPLEERLEQSVPLSSGALEGVVRSLSYGEPALGARGTAALLEAVAALGATHGAVWARRLRLCWLRRGRRSRPPRRHPPRR
jgi:SAM-dependent methyltransferase